MTYTLWGKFVKEEWFRNKLWALTRRCRWMDGWFSVQSVAYKTFPRIIPRTTSFSTQDLRHTMSIGPNIQTVRWWTTHQCTFLYQEFIFTCSICMPQCCRWTTIAVLSRKLWVWVPLVGKAVSIKLLFGQQRCCRSSSVCLLWLWDLFVNNYMSAEKLSFWTDPTGSTWRNRLRGSRVHHEVQILGIFPAWSFSDYPN